MTVQQQIAARIARLRRLVALEGMEDTAEEIAKAVAKDAAIEPPERPGQVYVRTHTLSGSWATEPVRRAARRIITGATNRTPYGKWVQGTADQAAIHQGRWRTERRLADDNRAEARQRVRRALLALWRRR